MRFNALYVFLGIVFGVPFAFILVINIVDYYQEMNWEPPPWPPSTERVQHPHHIRWGEAALNRYNAFSPTEQKVMREAIGAVIQPLDTWIAEIDRQEFDFLCLGENHDDYIRRFAAEHVFNVLRYDILFLESTQEEADDLIDQVNDGEERVELLGADIGPVIRAILDRNPDVEIFGIEETVEQREARQETLEGGRETTIEKNFRGLYQPGKKHLMLYGAFHCSNTWNWLYYRLKQNPQKLTGAQTRSIRLNRAHIEGPIEAFVYFLDEINVAPTRHFVITENAELPEEIKKWFPFFRANELGISESMIVFRPEAVDPISESH